MKCAAVTALAFSLLSVVPALAAEGRDYNSENNRERERVQGRREVRPPERHVWQRGERLPAEFARGHEVVDWRARRLRPPPRGYHWVDVDGDFVLAALATGVVLDYALANPYPPTPYPDDYAYPDAGPYPPEYDGGAPPPGGPYPPPPGAGSAPTWFYCRNPQGYYPYVRSCNQNWEPVSPTPPPPPPR